MNGKKIIVAALSSTLLIGAVASASYAAPGDDHDHGHKPRHGMHHAGMGPGHFGPPPEVLFVRMVKQFDKNGDMKVSKDELKAGVDEIFDKIDTNKDGEITPKEARDYRTKRMKAWREERAKMQTDNKGDAKQDGDQAKADDGDMPPPPPPGEHGMGGPHGHWMHRAQIGAAMMFARIDTDGDGRISKQEAENGANKLFDRLDRNKDGVISIDDMPGRPFL